MRIGILGGTFDPPHYGHVELAQAAIEELQLDEVIWIPAARNPLKKGRAGASSAQRLEMAKMATEGKPKFAVSDIEVARGGPSFTVETLHELGHALPGEYWLILGADALRSFGDWKGPERILKMARLAVAQRDGSHREEMIQRIPEFVQEKVDWLESKLSEVSSSEIRDRISRDLPVSNMLAPAVLRYIQLHKLYRN